MTSPEVSERSCDIEAKDIIPRLPWFLTRHGGEGEPQAGAAGNAWRRARL